jgi:hypothetical protein
MPRLCISQSTLTSRICPVHHKTGLWLEARLHLGCYFKQRAEGRSRTVARVVFFTDPVVPSALPAIV